MGIVFHSGCKAAGGRGGKGQGRRMREALKGKQGWQERGCPGDSVERMSKRAGEG